MLPGRRLPKRRLMNKDPRFSGDYGTIINKDAEELWYKKCSWEAQYAYENGQKASEQELLRQACFWFGRASRLATKDVKVAFAYSMALLKAGQFERALLHLRALKKKLDDREVVFSECLGLWGAGKRAEAAESLKEVLPHYVPPSAFHDLIETLVTQEQKPGWVELSNSGLLKIHASQPVSLTLDGRKLGVFDDKTLWLGSAFQEGLCPGWAQGRNLSVKAGGEHLLGSPLNISSLTRCNSLVWPDASGLKGWLWYPAEPEFIPHILINNRSWLVVDEAAEINQFNPLGHAKSFSISLQELAEQGRDLVRLHNDHQVSLTGAPVDPRLGRVIERKTPYPAQYLPLPVQSRPLRSGIKRAKAPRCVVIIPVYGDYAATMACLKSVLETIPASVELVVIDDASPERSIVRALDRLAAEGRITLLRNKENLGFPASVNKGFHYVQNADVILLNSDTLVFSGWVERLREWLSLRDVGTVTPFSNHATLLSYPSVKEENPVPDKREARLIDQLCQENGTATEIELPTANGFCMAISAECLAETGFFRATIFAQGYGEENDFCLRATARGFRHLAGVNIYVRHTGGSSFKKNRLPLIERNVKFLNALHPGYDMAVAEFAHRDPLHLVRRRLDFLLMTKKGRKKGAVLLIEHNYGGGVARAVQQRAEFYEQQGILALRLRPSSQGCVLELCRDPALWPNLHFALPEENILLATCLRKIGVQFIEWHHLAGHAPWIRRLHHFLGVPFDIFVHDHVWFCPRITLLNHKGYYCGERGVQACRECIKHDPVTAQEEVTIDGLLERSSEEFLAARSITAPTFDAAQRLVRHFPDLRDVTVQALEDETSFPPVRPLGRTETSVCRIGVLGGISRWKGYDVLHELGRYIQQTALPIQLILIGGTEDDRTLMDAGIQVTGTYDDKDVLSLIAEAEVDIGFIPSIAPETWSYALSWLWKAGLEVVCFDIGAVRERIQRRGAGTGVILPLGFPVDRLANYILRHVMLRKNRQ